MIPRKLVSRIFPLLCGFGVLFVFVSQSSVYLRGDSGATAKDMIRLFQSLHRAQMENLDISLRVLNGSENLAENSTKTESTDEKEQRTTREWFDKRPGAKPFQRAGSKHPLFPGYVLESPDICKDEPVDILIYLHSSAANQENRRYIREGWANANTFIDISIRLVFLLGLPQDSDLQSHIESEYATYGDIVQGYFSDTFRNLTYKAVTLLTWANAHCSQARYIIKVDDDMFVDIYRVITEIIPKLAPKGLAVACDYKENLDILRDKGNKWRVEDNILKGQKKWPPFCSGYFLVMTAEAIPQLYEASFNINEFVSIDDAYMFGLLVMEKNISLEYLNIHELTTINDRPDPDREININGKFEYLAFRTKKPEDHWKLHLYRSNKLTSWDQKHNQFYLKFLSPKRKSMVTF